MNGAGGYLKSGFRAVWRFSPRFSRLWFETFFIKTPKIWGNDPI